MRVVDREKYSEIVEVINDYFFENGRSPSVRDIADAAKMTIPRAARYLEWMGEEEIIEYDKGTPRSATTETIRKAKCGHKPIPIVGTIACGTPALAEVNIESYMTVSTELLGRGEYYFLKASGDSMIGAGIDDGDLVLIKYQEEAWGGQIVVACTEDGETTLKRYYKDDTLRLIRLSPENKAMEDVLVKECRIQGIALKVIKNLN